MPPSNTWTIRRRSPVCFFFAILFAILAGCTAHYTKQDSASGIQDVVCNKDTDTFCIENDQQKAARLNQQGLEFARKQDYDSAVQLFKQAATLDDANPKYLYNLGVAYDFKGMKGEAEAAYMATLAIKPSDPVDGNFKSAQLDAYYNLACLYALQGKKDQAFEHLDKLASLGAGQAYHFTQSDKDLDSLRDDPRFKLLLEKIAHQEKPSQTDSPLH